MPDRGPSPADANSSLDPASPGPPTSANAAQPSGPAQSGTPGPPGPESAQAGPEPFVLAAEPFSLTGGGVATDGDEAPEGRGKRRRVLLIGLLAVAVAGAGVGGWAAWQITTQKDATITPPAQLAGIPQDTSDSSRGATDYLQTALSAEVDLDKSTGAIYTSGKSNADILFVGGTGLIWSPSTDLDAAFGLVSDKQGAVTNVHDVPAGKYGGTMKCGTTKTDDGQMPVCGWSDHGSLGLALFPGRTEPEAAKVFLELRNNAQTRN